MSRIVAVTFLLIVLVDNFCENAGVSSGFYVKNVHIRKCRCKVLLDGRMKCPNPIFPTNPSDELALMKCLCSKTNRHKVGRFCSSVWKDISTPL